MVSLIFTNTSSTKPQVMGDRSTRLNHPPPLPPPPKKYSWRWSPLNSCIIESNKCTLSKYFAEVYSKQKDTTSHIFKIFEVRFVLHCLLHLLLKIVKAVEMIRQLEFLSTGFQVKVVSQRILPISYKAPALPCARQIFLNKVVKLHHAKQKIIKTIIIIIIVN